MMRCVYILFQSAVYSAMKLVFLYICVLRRYVPYMAMISLYDAWYQCVLWFDDDVYIKYVISITMLESTTVMATTVAWCWYTEHCMIMWCSLSWRALYSRMDSVIMRTLPWWCDHVYHAMKLWMLLYHNVVDCCKSISCIGLCLFRIRRWRART